MRTLSLYALTLALVACQNTSTEPVDDPAPVVATPDEDAPTTTVSDEMEENMPTEPMDEAMPAETELIGEGTFSGASGHDVSGVAKLFRHADGTHTVRLEGFESDNGPDLKLYLVRRTTGDVGAGGVSLGALKSTNGNQNYSVPASTDPGAFAGVSVWCEQFSVNFGTAPLG